ncbi:hypothetical protein IC766_14490 [Acinetobacter seifertii]|uniref:hypothetical protein n=1 Tax=Acinetobacter seifertii TaxID=1530123 RepID=UPI00168BD4A9|nr:hypothetical protein [Acinetobacter seifertii]QNY13307.1 hypothetical protein IC766_14490 [Acinetobacter seifertii]
MTDLNKEREVNLRFEQDDGFVWVFDGDSQFGTEISHLMMMHSDEYNEDELRVICNHAACEIDRLRAELEKAKAQAVPNEIINKIQSWVAVKSFAVEDAHPDLPIIDANELAEFIEQLVKSESGAEG